MPPPKWLQDWDSEDAAFHPPPTLARAGMGRPVGIGQIVPSSTAISLAGAVACGLAGWWLAGMVKDDENAHLMGAGIGVIAGLILF
jgi:hypothetical protein